MTTARYQVSKIVAEWLKAKESYGSVARFCTCLEKGALIDAMPRGPRPHRGKHRPFVKEVAKHLAATFGEARVLYDNWYDAEFARLGLDVELPNLYRTQSELIALFLYPAYKDISETWY